VIEHLPGDAHRMYPEQLLDRLLPRRLIEVGDTDMDLKLCKSEFLPRETRYLTLSHSWAGKVLTTLTHNNFEKFFLTSLLRVLAEHSGKLLRPPENLDSNTYGSIHCELYKEMSLVGVWEEVPFKFPTVSRILSEDISHLSRENIYCKIANPLVI
jgi:hypothetical protein